MNAWISTNLFVFLLTIFETFQAVKSVVPCNGSMSSLQWNYGFQCIQNTEIIVGDEFPIVCNCTVVWDSSSPISEIRWKINNSKIISRLVYTKIYLLIISKKWILIMDISGRLINSHSLSALQKQNS